MLINKWLITDRIAAVAGINAPTGICIKLNRKINEGQLFFEAIQKNLMFTPSTIFLEEDTGELNEDVALIEDIVSLFFQPSYYTENGRPIVFVRNSTETPFKQAVLKKSLAQGIRPVEFKEVSSQMQLAAPQKCFNFLLTNGAVDFKLLLKRWINQCIEQKGPSPIHLLVSAANTDATEILNDLEEQEASVKCTDQFRLALFLYAQQQLIEDYKLQLEIKTAEEKNVRLYLSIQKEERANALKWYEKEYEVLPLWYKQFGHIIKVITGKRTLRSLFQDDVKKLKV